MKFSQFLAAEKIVAPAAGSLFMIVVTAMNLTNVLYDNGRKEQVTFDDKRLIEGVVPW